MHIKKMTAVLALALAVGAVNYAGAADAGQSPAGSTNAAAAAKSSDLFAGNIVAKGKGVEVSRSRLDEELVTIKSSAAASGRDIPAEQMRMLEQQILERLIQIQLLSSKATDADRAKGKETSTKRFDAIIKRAGSEEALLRQLKSVGMTLDQLRAKMVEESVAEAVLERELKINVTDEEVKKFYDENPAKFERPEQVRASHILLSTKDDKGNELPAEKKEAKRKQIEDLLKKARAGEDFAKLAKEYSEDPGSKEKGGEYTFGRNQMVPEFETAAFGLKTNEVSDVVTTQFGYHIIKLYEKLPAEKMALDKVSSDIRDYLKQQQAGQQLPEYMEKVKKEAGVQVLDENLKIPAKPDLDIPPPTLPPSTNKPAAPSGKK